MQDIAKAIDLVEKPMLYGSRDFSLDGPFHDRSPNCLVWNQWREIM